MNQQTATHEQAPTLILDGKFLLQFPLTEELFKPTQSEALERSLASLSLLPLYSFGEPSPFEPLRICIHQKICEGRSDEEALYGSLYAPWTEDNRGALTGWKLCYEGDGFTRSFQLVASKELRIHRLPTTIAA